MPVASLLTSAASFLYAVSSMLDGAQNNANVQQSFLNNFQSTPTHFLPLAQRNGINNPYPKENPGDRYSDVENNIYEMNFLNGSDINAMQGPVVHFPMSGYPQTKSTFPVRSNSGRALAGPGPGPVPLEVSYHDGETIATLITDGYGNVTRCELLEVNKPEEQQAALAQLAAKNQLIEKTNFNTMINIIRACQALDKGKGQQVPTSAIEALVQNKANMWTIVNGILPGTKWCGVRDIADGWNDLGPQRELDKCCRSHDLCPRKVLGFRAAYGLVNWSFYTKSHCDCDAVLYDCLKHASAQNPTAHLLGNFYFNVLRVQCIDEENPPQCLQGNGISCAKWKDDDSRDKQRLVFRDVRQLFR